MNECGESDSMTACVPVDNVENIGDIRLNPWRIPQRISVMSADVAFAPGFLQQTRMDVTAPRARTVRSALRRFHILTS